MRRGAPWDVPARRSRSARDAAGPAEHGVGEADRPGAALGVARAGVAVRSALRCGHALPVRADLIASASEAAGTAVVRVVLHVGADLAAIDEARLSLAGLFALSLDAGIPELARALVVTVAAVERIVVHIDALAVAVDHSRRARAGAAEIVVVVVAVVPGVVRSGSGRDRAQALATVALAVVVVIVVVPDARLAAGARAGACVVAVLLVPHLVDGDLALVGQVMLAAPQAVGQAPDVVVAGRDAAARLLHVRRAGLAELVAVLAGERRGAGEEHPDRRAAAPGRRRTGRRGGGRTFSAGVRTQRDDRRNRNLQPAHEGPPAQPGPVAFHACWRTTVAPSTPQAPPWPYRGASARLVFPACAIAGCFRWITMVRWAWRSSSSLAMRKIVEFPGFNGRSAVKSSADDPALLSPGLRAVLKKTLR